jgi:hypothetical protein
VLILSDDEPDRSAPPSIALGSERVTDIGDAHASSVMGHDTPINLPFPHGFIVINEHIKNFKICFIGFFLGWIDVSKSGLTIRFDVAETRIS